MCLGIPGQIIAITDREKRLATVDIAGVQREACVTCVCEPEQDPDELIGAWVLIHVGFAMAKISAVEAEYTLQLLSEMAAAGATDGQ